MRSRLSLPGALGGIVLMACLAGCVHPPPPKNYAAFRAADPHAILIVPVVNDSSEVDASADFLATLSQPIADRGYYVFPVNLVKHVMDDSGLGDASLVAQAPAQRVARLFGADAVLYAKIDRWTAQYVFLSTTIIVKIYYVLKDGKTGRTLWDRHVKTVYQPQGASAGNPLAALIADAIAAAIERAHPNYIPLAQQTNIVAFDTPEQGLPYGPDSSKHGGF